MQQQQQRQSGHSRRNSGSSSGGGSNPPPQISFESAVASLQSMFGADTWPAPALAKVLKDNHYNMERTVESILQMGGVPPPGMIGGGIAAAPGAAASSSSASSTPSASPAPGQAGAGETDAQLARRLSMEWNGPVPDDDGQEGDAAATSTSGRGSAASNPMSAPSPMPPPLSSRRGRPVVLPDDFLRVPGRNHVTPAQQMLLDEQLARMLQDENFLQENPELRRHTQGGGALPPHARRPHHRPQSGYPADRQSNSRPSSTSPSFADVAEESLDNIRQGVTQMSNSVKRGVTNLYSRFINKKGEGRAHVPLADQQEGEEEEDGEVLLFHSGDGAMNSTSGGAAAAAATTRRPSPQQQQQHQQQQLLSGGIPPSVSSTSSTDEEVLFSSGEAQRMV